MSREPTLVDGVAYYVADGISSALQDGLTSELKKKRPDGWTIAGEILGIFVSEATKVGVNSQVDPHFKSVRDARNEDRRKQRLAGEEETRR